MSNKPIVLPNGVTLTTFQEINTGATSVAAPWEDKDGCCWRSVPCDEYDRLRAIEAAALKLKAAVDAAGEGIDTWAALYQRDREIRDAVDELLAALEPPNE